MPKELAVLAAQNCAVLRELEHDAPDPLDGDGRHHASTQPRLTAKARRQSSDERTDPAIDSIEVLASA
jgi:hypothetical protein